MLIQLEYTCFAYQMCQFLRQTLPSILIATFNDANRAFSIAWAGFFL